MIIFNVCNEMIDCAIVNIFPQSRMRNSKYNSRSCGIKDVRESTVVANLGELMICQVISRKTLQIIKFAANHKTIAY